MYLSTALALVPPADPFAAAVAATTGWLAVAVTAEGETLAAGADTELDFDAALSFVALGAGSALAGIGPGSRIL